MPAILITDSLNIASLDSKILADLCAGVFTVDLTPSIWISSGASNVLGASVQITNPYNVVIKYYPTSGYDIYPPMSSSVNVNVPTQANNYQYGNYSISVRLTDANGTTYTVSKTISICAPNPKNKTVGYGSLSAEINGNCKEGKVYIIADTPPTYKGSVSDSQINAFTLEYPTSSGMSVLSTDIGSFSDYLFEGVYKFNGTICAHYSLGDNVFANVNYKVKREKNIRCLLDETCIYAKLAQLDAQTKSDCSDAEKQDTQTTIVNALRLIKTIEVSADSGFDASDYIDELEDVLGCVCTCNCADGTPIINNNPAKDFIITGCNVEKTTVGLTDSYVIDNFVYTIAITDNGGAITITAPVLSDCTQTQTITFNIGVVYAQIKNQIVNSTEYNYWAAIINHAWDSLSLTCLPNVSQLQWNSYTYAQRTQAILSQLCVGASCNAIIAANTTTASGADVVIDWQSISGVFQTDIFVDNILEGSVLQPNSIFTVVNGADGNPHTYTLVSKCANGSVGILLQGNYTYFGCPSIAAPTVTNNNVTGDCPYDLTSLVGALPPSISSEWHNAYNTSNTSLVANPSMSLGGVYYVYGKNAQGCYSALATRVILTCTASTSCTAPQNAIVETISGGNRVRFQGAEFPPPGNSYTVKRRLTSDPDVGGSYTTIGAPTYNSGAGRWEILDATASDNTLYTYRSISNCSTTAPYIDYVYANIVCPTLTLTPHTSTVDYSFVNSGGGISKYEIYLYSTDGVTLIHVDTKLPAFANPITGTFIYLNSGTGYKVQLKVYIGTYSKTCDFVSVTTSVNTNIHIANNIANLILTNTTVGGNPWFAYVNGALPLSNGQSLDGLHGAFTGAVAMNISGSYASLVRAGLYVNGNLTQCIDIVSPGFQVFSSGSYLSTDIMALILSPGGSCPATYP